MPSIDDRMRGKVCLVTGATSGIGEVTAKALAQMGAVVIVAGRSREKAERVVREIKEQMDSDDVRYLLADMASQDEIRAMAAKFKNEYDRLDVLVNNAGVVLLNREESAEGIEKTFAVNHLGYFLLTNLLLDEIRGAGTPQDPARIVNVSSGAHRGAQINFEDLQRERGYNAMTVYGESKLANLLFTYELARRLKDEPVTVNALHPGFVATGFAMNNGWLARLLMPVIHLFARTPEEGAQTAIYLAMSPEVKSVSGKYFVDEQPVSSSQASCDEETARHLWQVSAEMTGLSSAV